MSKLTINSYVFLKHLLNVGIESVKPVTLINDNFHNNRFKCHNSNIEIYDNVYVVGFGKAALGFLNPLYNLLKCKFRRAILSVPIINESELINKPDLFKLSDELLDITSIYYGSRSNVPNEETIKASNEIFKLVQSLNANDSLIVVITGGGSALLCLPPNDITLRDIVEVSNLLSMSGASIVELNTIRRQIDLLKGGGLANFANAGNIISLILSDVIGDDISIIASGPTVNERNNDLSPLDIIHKYNLLSKISPNVIKILKSSKPNSIHSFDNVHNCVIGNNKIALNAISIEAENNNLKSFILSTTMDGDCELRSLQLFRFLEALYTYRRNQIIEIRQNLYSFAQELKFDSLAINNLLESFAIKKNYEGVCLLIGGEMPVTINGSSTGIGGRCSHMALSVACFLENSILNGSKISILFGASDGMDGATDCSGAIIYPEMCSDSQRQSIDSASYLANYDSYNFFKQFHDGKYFLKTGMTGTNVMDLIIVIIPHE